MNRRYCCRSGAGIYRAVRWSSDHRSSSGHGLNDARQRLFRHGAVVRSIAAAADRKTRVVATLESGRERPQPDEQHEQDGECASHAAIDTTPGVDAIRI